MEGVNYGEKVFSRITKKWKCLISLSFPFLSLRARANKITTPCESSNKGDSQEALQ